MIIITYLWAYNSHKSLARVNLNAMLWVLQSKYDVVCSRAISELYTGKLPTAAHRASGTKPPIGWSFTPPTLRTQQQQAEHNTQKSKQQQTPAPSKPKIFKINMDNSTEISENTPWLTPTHKVFIIIGSAVLLLILFLSKRCLWDPLINVCCPGKFKWKGIGRADDVELQEFESKPTAPLNGSSDGYYSNNLKLTTK